MNHPKSLHSMCAEISQDCFRLCPLGIWWFRSTSCSLPSASCQMLQQKVKSSLHKATKHVRCLHASGSGGGGSLGHVCMYEWFVLICDVWWWCWLHCHKSGPSDVVCRSHKKQAQDLRLENMGTYSTRPWRKTLTTFDIWGVELSPGWAPSINLTKLESSKWQIWISFYVQKKRLKPKGTCSLQFLSWRLLTLDNFKLLTTPQFGGIRSNQEESDGIVVSAHQFSGLLAVFGLTRWANSLWTATDILVPLKGTYPLRMRHQPECAYASLKKMPLVLRFWDVKLICLIHPHTSWYCMPVCVLWSLGFSDFPGTTCGSWNCNPGCAGHTTNVCPPQWDFWALNVSGKAAWWPTNLAKHREDNLWKKMYFYMKIDRIIFAWISFLILQLFTSLSLCCTCFLLFSTKKKNVAVDHRHRLYGTAMDSMSKILPGQGPLWSSDLECLRRSSKSEFGENFPEKKKRKNLKWVKSTF